MEENILDYEQKPPKKDRFSILGTIVAIIVFIFGHSFLSPLFLKLYASTLDRGNMTQEWASGFTVVQLLVIIIMLFLSMSMVNQSFHWGNIKNNKIAGYSIIAFGMFLPWMYSLYHYGFFDRYEDLLKIEGLVSSVLIRHFIFLGVAGVIVEFLARKFNDKFY